MGVEIMQYVGQNSKKIFEFAYDVYISPAMEPLSRMLENWSYQTDYIRNTYLSGILKIVPGAADTSCFNAYQLIELIHRLSTYTGRDMSIFITVWKELCKRERAAAFAAELREIISTTRAPEHTVAPDAQATMSDAQSTVVDALVVVVQPNPAAEKQQLDSPDARLNKWKLDNETSIRNWCDKNYVDYHIATTRYAAAHNLISVLDDCLAASFCFHSETTYFAIANGHLDVVKWLHEHDKLENGAQLTAVECDKIHILKCLLERDVTVDSDALKKIAELGRLKMLQLAAVLHYGAITIDVRDIAVDHCHSKMVDWIDLVI